MMKLSFRHDWSKTSKRSYVVMELRGKPEGFFPKGRLLFSIHAMDFTGILLKLKRSKHDNNPVANFATPIDCKAAQEELLARLSARRPQKFDPYAPGKNDKIVTDEHEHVDKVHKIMNAIVDSYHLNR